MPRVAHMGFTVYVIRGKHRLTLRRFLPDLASALGFAKDVSAIRPTGNDGMFILDEAGGAMWSVEELIQRSGTGVDPPLASASDATGGE